MMASARSLIAASLLMVGGPVHSQGSGTGTVSEGGPRIGLHHAAMTVSEIDSTIAFYSSAVPFPVVKRFKVRGSAFPSALLSGPRREVEIAIVATPTGFIQLMDFDPARRESPNVRPVTGPGYTHICFQSGSSDPAIKRFRAAGLAIVSRFGPDDGVDIGGYGVRYAYGRDPDGIMIENESLDRPKRSERAWLNHIANVVHDRDAMLDFYTRLLGRKPHRTTEQENNPRLDDVADLKDSKIRGGWISLGNMDVEVWEFVRPRTPLSTKRRTLDEIGYNAFAIEVEDLGRESRRLRALGIPLIGKPVLLGGFRVQYGHDPEGNLFSLVEVPRSEPGLSLRSLGRPAAS
jgi:catechol 2,3-dioxygenase-like lactoylglutathione lyase family enzyme